MQSASIIKLAQESTFFSGDTGQLLASRGTFPKIFPK